MITIFNRKELLSTFDMQRQGAVRQLLGDKGIDYSVKVINRGGPSPAGAGNWMRTGSMGEKLSMEYEYIIYVNKSQYEEACAVLRSLK